MSTLSDTQNTPAAREASSSLEPASMPTGQPARIPAHTPAGAYYQFKPYNVGRWVIWTAFAAVLVLAPMLFTSSLSHTMLSQMGIAIIVCLSYNMLLGQGGMLSFGHAVYSGFGAYLAIHTLNMVTNGQAGVPVSLIPLIGGLGGMAFAVLLGSILTPADAARVGAKLLRALMEPFRVSGVDVAVATSLGIGQYPEDGAQPEALLRRAVSLAAAAQAQGRAGLSNFGAGGAANDE